jgi:TonB family protein
MRFSWGNKLAALMVVGSLAGSLALAQAVTSDDHQRKVQTRLNPQFSDLARKMNLNGKVKIEIVIAPDGHVKSSRAVGGHPLLVQSCLEAIKDWRFEPAPEETTQVVEFEFKGQ